MQIFLGEKNDGRRPAKRTTVARARPQSAGRRGSARDKFERCERSDKRAPREHRVRARGHACVNRVRVGEHGVHACEHGVRGDGVQACVNGVRVGGHARDNAVRGGGGYARGHGVPVSGHASTEARRRLPRTAAATRLARVSTRATRVAAVQQSTDRTRRAHRPPAGRLGRAPGE